jgi:hypothetical protein
MSLEHIFYLSQIIAALALVASLLFVALELRNSTRESRHRAGEEAYQKFREVQLETASNADLARIWAAGVHDFSRSSRLIKLDSCSWPMCFLRTGRVSFSSTSMGDYPMSCAKRLKAWQVICWATPAFKQHGPLERDTFIQTIERTLTLGSRLLETTTTP